MAWVTMMELSVEQDRRLRLYRGAGGPVERWFLKKEAAIALASSYLPGRGVATRVSVVGANGSRETREYVAQPWYPDGAIPPEWSPVESGAVDCTVYHVPEHPPFLPIIQLHDKSTSQAVSEYLRTCSHRSVVRWLHGVGRLAFLRPLLGSQFGPELEHAAGVYQFTSFFGIESLVMIVRGMLVISSLNLDPQLAAMIIAAKLRETYGENLTPRAAFQIVQELLNAPEEEREQWLRVGPIKYHIRDETAWRDACTAVLRTLCSRPF